MSLPEFYRPDRVGSLYRPDVARAVQEGLNAGIRPASSDEQRRMLLLVDEQVDFVHEDGSLSVPGAVADTRRVIEWIIKNMEKITTIVASLDSHIPIQIFFQTWWMSLEGKYPEPYTPITTQDVEQKRWRPIYETEWSMDYVYALKKKAKKDLMIWPYHTLIGTQGHNITPSLYEAIAYYSAARRSKPEFIVKGTIAKTEYYSLLEPEVKVEEDPRGTLNREFLERLLSYDAIYIAGQAKSHCVLETITSIMERYGEQREIVEKLNVLTDCTSSVQHPEIDFEAMAQEAYKGFEEKGLHLITTGDPVP
jgi:nicotinamidase/pyrazinamidase